MSDKVYVDAIYKSLNKYTEELCGDRVEIVKNDDCCIVVLSDGLGSGVKANILSTLTSKIISTMIIEGASIEDTVDTIVHTLPVCSVRKVAYSTFSILRIGYDGDVYLVEFDSPNCIFVRDGQILKIDYEIKEIAGKKIKEARFKAQIGDLLTIMSDGVIYAGIGATLNLGWNWNNASNFIAEQSRIYKGITSSKLANLVIEKCNELYLGKAGDDTTVATVKIIPLKTVNILTGPPENPEDDPIIVNDFLASDGMKIVSGGSSANIFCRVTKKVLKTSIEYVNPDVPPVGYIDGIDLVTEGVLTLKRTLDILKGYFKNPTDKQMLNALEQKDGASSLAKILAQESTHINLFVGRKINPAHQNPAMPTELNIRTRIIDDLCNVLIDSGKVVNIKYY